MEIITKEYAVYDYAELSDEAKEVVKQWYLDDPILPDLFTEDCMMRLEELFPMSNLKVEYSLCYCQGDGFNIYGRICLGEMLEKIKTNFTEKELKFFDWAFNRYGDSFNMESNRRYTYCICSDNDFSENLLEDMEYECMRSIPTATLEKFNELVGKYLDDLCKEFEEAGYRYFYEISDEDLQDACEANEWKFTIDGKFFAA